MRSRDPLLRIVRILLNVGMIGAVAVTAAFTALIVLLPLWRGRALAELSARAGAAVPVDIPYAICGIMALVAMSGVLVFLFVGLLRRIIDSVAAGDPFIPENAVRLERMGWLAAMIQLLAIPADVLTGWIAHASHIERMDFGFSIGGIMLALILFVLARVFRKGAEMRDELEGTV